MKNGSAVRPFNARKPHKHRKEWWFSVKIVRDAVTGALHRWYLWALFHLPPIRLSQSPPLPASPHRPYTAPIGWCVISFPDPLFSVNKYLSEMWPPTDIYVMLDEVSFTDHTEAAFKPGRLGGEQANADAALKAGKSQT